MTEEEREFLHRLMEERDREEILGEWWGDLVLRAFGLLLLGIITVSVLCWPESDPLRPW